MRVLHVAKYYPPRPGGMESFVRDLATALSPHDPQLVLAHAHEPGPCRDETVDGVRVVRVPCHGSLLYAPVSPSYPLHLRRLAREFAPDVIHLHMPNVSAFWALAPGVLAKDTPLVIHWHADVVFPRRQRLHRLAYGPYAAFERALLRRARRVVATSPDYLEHSWPLAPFRNKCEAVPLGLDETRLARPSDALVAQARQRWLGRDGTHLVLAVGRFAHYKGFPVLARAMAEVAGRIPGARLVIAGGGEEHAATAEAARRAGVADRVLLPGRVSDAELTALMHAADLFVLPSLERSEAFGVVLLEAMAASLPLLTTAIPGSGVNHVNAHGQTGLAVPPGDESSLAEAVAGLLDDEPRRKAMAEAARQRFQEHFTMPAVARAMRAVYEAALDGPRTRDTGGAQ